MERQLEEAVGRFVHGMVELLSQAGVGGLLELAGSEKKGPERTGQGAGSSRKRLHRRDSSEVEELERRAVEYVRRAGGGVGMVELVEKLGVDRKRLSHPVHRAVVKRLLKKRGQRQFTRYYVRENG